MKHLLTTEQRIILTSALLVLVTGILVSVTATVPMYRSVRAQLEEVSLANAQARQKSIESQMSSYQAIAGQFSSRTEIRKRLEAWHKGEISLAELQAFSLPRLQEPARQAPHLAAMFRVSNGHTIVATGPSAEQLQPMLTETPAVPLIIRNFADDPSLLLIQASSPIISASGEILGHDILFFHTTELLHHLQGFGNYGQQAEVFLANCAAGLALGLHSNGKQAVSRPDMLDMLRTNPHMQQAGIHLSADRNQVFVVEPCTASTMRIVIRVPEAVFYQAAHQNLLWVSLLILALLILSIPGSRAAIQPLIKRLTRQTAQLEESRAQLQLAATVFEKTHEPIAITDPQLRIVKANKALHLLCDHQQQDLTGQLLTQLVDVDPAGCTPESLLATLQQAGSWQAEVLHAPNEDGQQRTSLLSISAVHDPHEQLLYYIHIFSDITARTVAENEVRRKAAQDPLTGLLNRTSMLTRLHDCIARDTAFSVLFIDLDNFKPVNDTHGHQTGDEILRQVAKRLQSITRDKDSMARLGGDEFLLLLETPTNKGFVTRIAHQAAEQLARPFEIDGTKVLISASVGVAHYPEHGQTPELVIHAADLAMYQTKRGGGSSFTIADGNTANE